VGPIPRGIYRIRSREVSDPGLVKDLLRNLRGDWGDWRVPLHPLTLTRESILRLNRDPDSFFLHGGRRRGSAGCVDAGGGLLGGSLTDQLLFDIMSDPDGLVPFSVQSAADVLLVFPLTYLSIGR